MPGRVALMRVDDPGYPHPSSPAAAAVMRGNRGRDTGPEVALRSALHRRGLRFKKHSRPIPDLRSTPDVVFAGARVAVFLDGCFWHRCPEHGNSPRVNSAYWSAKLDGNVARDRCNDAALREAGWEVVRVWEHEDPAAAADRLLQMVSRRVAAPRAVA